MRRIATERTRLTAILREQGFEVSDSQANFLWIAHPTLDGAELTSRLSNAGVLVAAGSVLGEPRHVRVAVHDEAASTRLLSALEQTLA